MSNYDTTMPSELTQHSFKQNVMALLKRDYPGYHSAILESVMRETRRIVDEQERAPTNIGISLSDQPLVSSVTKVEFRVNDVEVYVFMKFED